MDIFGIGPLEVFFILLIALIIFGPNDMVKAGRTIGSFLRKLITSPSWRLVQQTSNDLRHLPNKLIREAGMEEDLTQMKELAQPAELTEVNAELKDLQNSIAPWTTPPTLPLPQTPSPNVEEGSEPPENQAD
jgi:Sec-independent protein translocase protein TatA